LALKKELQEKIQYLKNTGCEEYARDLLKREHTLKEREDKLWKKNQKFSMSLINFEQKMKKFNQDREKTITCLNNNQQREDKRIDKMVEIISSMKNDKAADLIAIQDWKISVKILLRLTPSKVSKLFNQMDKEISARLQKQFLSMKK
jgi:flagellar motility protein MotE (MotC chaperone)